MARIHTSTLILFIGGLALGGCQQQPSSSYPSETPTDQSATPESPDMGADTSMAEEETPAETPPPAEEPKPVLTDKGREFIMKAGHSGVAEIELSKVALENSKTQSIKDFAQKMIDAHTKMGEDLTALGERLGTPPPTTLDEEMMKKKDELGKLKGKKLDQKYVDIMVENHQKSAETMRDQAEDAENPDLQAFAAANLPTVEEHLEHAKALDKGKTYKGPTASLSHSHSHAAVAPGAVPGSTATPPATPKQP